MPKRKGPHTPGQAHPTEAPQVHAAHHLDTVPTALQAVALIDGPTCAAVGQISISTWHELVRTGDAPQPVIRGARCSRWRLVDVRDYWQRRAEQGSPQAAARLLAQSRKGAAAALAKRAGVAAQ
jgi:predicted DNA-binding transcriptional regulator AlpA